MGLEISSALKGYSGDNEDCCNVYQRRKGVQQLVEPPVGGIVMWERDADFRLKAQNVKEAKFTTAHRNIEEKEESTGGQARPLMEDASLRAGQASGIGNDNTIGGPPMR